MIYVPPIVDQSAVESKSVSEEESKEEEEKKKEEERRAKLRLFRFLGKTQLLFFFNRSQLFSRLGIKPCLSRCQARRQ